ncbi:MAG TPA: hypothetical protein VMB79_07780 [Jatrophihabitans sp.]|nr:hypothetical protein [Jatrophihabitans sp.]
MPELEVLTRDEIVQRRKRLLAETSMSEDELRTRAANYTLTPRESGILAEIDGLEFLLGA